MDALAQVIERRKVFAPMAIKALQHDVALELMPGLEIDDRHLGGVGLVGRDEDALEHFVVVQGRFGLDPLPDRHLELELRLERLLECRDLPLLLDAFLGHIGAKGVVDDALAHRRDRFGDVVGGEQLVALLVDHLALVVRDVVIFEQLLADVEVALLDLALRRLERARHHAGFDGLALGHLETHHDGVEPLAGEDLHQRVFEREVETARPGIALAPGTTAKLIVDAPRFVPLRADDLEAAGVKHLLVQLLPFLAQRLDARRLVGLGNGSILLERCDLALGVAAEHDIGAAAGHVGGDGHHARTTRLNDDLGFARMLLGVEHLMRQLCIGQQLGEEFRVLDRGGADQHRLTALVAVADVLDDGVEFFLGGAVDEIILVLADHRPVGRNHHRLEAVYLVEFVGFGIGGTGHAGELAVHAEVVLEGDRGKGLVLGLDLHPFLGLNRLVQTVRPAASGHQATGEFVDDHHFTVLHHILLVAVIQRVGAQGRIEMVHQRDVGRLVEARAALQHAQTGQDLFGVDMAFFGEQHLVRLEVHRIVARHRDVVALAFLLGEHRRDLVHLQVELGVVLGLPGNDQRRARFVDEDRIDFVDDCIVEAALHPLGGGVDHVVAQVVEAELVVGAVGDVGRVGFLLGGMRHLRKVHPHAEPEETIDATHPLGIAAGQVVVHRDDMDALAGQRVEVDRQRRRQGLALAGAHLGNLAVVQHHAADHLHVEVAHAMNPSPGFANHREGFHQEVVQRGAVRKPLAEFIRLGLQRFVAELLDLRFERVDGAHGLGVLTDEPVVAATEDLFQKTRNHGLGWGLFAKRAYYHAGVKGLRKRIACTARLRTEEAILSSHRARIQLVGRSIRSVAAPSRRSTAHAPAPYDEAMQGR